ncbi:MAG TPA: DUF4279 domain-containing protein [Stellaceae bacterium]
MGDKLEPGWISDLLGVQPETAYRKREVYKRSRGHEVRGRTGLWLLSSERQIDSTDLNDHLAYLLGILFPAEKPDLPRSLRALMQKEALDADVSCFWYGERGATPPEILEEIRAGFGQIGATIETDFDTD